MRLPRFARNDTRMRLSHVDRNDTRMRLSHVDRNLKPNPSVYQRYTAAPQVKPAPKATIATISPFLSFSSAHSS